MLRALFRQMLTSLSFRFFLLPCKSCSLVSRSSICEFNLELVDFLVVFCLARNDSTEHTKKERIKSNSFDLLYLNPLADLFALLGQRVELEAAAERILRVRLLLGLAFDHFEPFHLLLFFERSKTTIV